MAQDINDDLARLRALAANTAQALAESMRNPPPELLQRMDELNKQVDVGLNGAPICQTCGGRRWITVINHQGATTEMHNERCPDCGRAANADEHRREGV